jgi:large-conductance mechanosensitive channel
VPAVAIADQSRSEQIGVAMLRGFRNFLMQGELVIIAVGLVVALAFSTLIKSFTDSIVTPLVNAAGGRARPTPVSAGR